METISYTETAPYRWMFMWKGGKDRAQTMPDDHLAWMFKDVREEYESLPKSAVTFKLKTLTDKSGEHTGNLGGMLTYLGAWEMPARFTNSWVGKWVNHRGRWAPKFSDASVQCECGATKYYTEDRMYGKGFDQRHDPSCTKVEEHETIAQMWRNRKRILETAALNRLPRRYAADRIGMTPESITKHCRLMNVDYDDLHAHACRKWRATMVMLRKQFDFTHRDLSDVFGVSRHTLREHINANLQIYRDSPDPADPRQEVVASD